MLKFLAKYIKYKGYKVKPLTTKCFRITYPHVLLNITNIILYLPIISKHILTK